MGTPMASAFAAVRLAGYKAEPVRPGGQRLRLGWLSGTDVAQRWAASDRRRTMVQ
jgi:hypothetical protein